MRIKIGLVLLIATLIFGCQNRRDKNIVPGSICLITDGFGTYGIIKVVTIDEHMVSFKIYTNRYQEAPAIIDLNTLKPDSAEQNKTAMMERKNFDTWKPTTVKIRAVK